MGYIENNGEKHPLTGELFGVDLFGPRGIGGNTTFLSGFDISYVVQRLDFAGGDLFRRTVVREGNAKQRTPSVGVQPFTRYAMSLIEPKETIKNKRVSEIPDMRIVDSGTGAVYALARFVVVTRRGVGLLEQTEAVDELRALRRVGAYPGTDDQVGVVLGEEIADVFPRGQIVVPYTNSRGGYIRALREEQGLSE